MKEECFIMACKQQFQTKIKKGYKLLCAIFKNNINKHVHANLIHTIYHTIFTTFNWWVQHILALEYSQFELQFSFQFNLFFSCEFLICTGALIILFNTIY